MPKKKRQSTAKQEDLAALEKSQQAESQGADLGNNEQREAQALADEQAAVRPVSPSAAMPDVISPSAFQAQDREPSQSASQTTAPAGKLSEAQGQLEEKKKALFEHLCDAKEDVAAAWSDFKGLLEAEKLLVENQLAEVKTDAIASIYEGRKAVSEMIHHLTEQAKQKVLQGRDAGVQKSGL